jgi:uncharacterized membrane protein YvbJ
MRCTKCGSTEEGQAKFCRQCGNALEGTEAPTVPITERMEEAPMHETDILIEIKAELRETKRIERGRILFVIIYADVDQKHKLPPGSTEQHLGQAAQESDMEIVTKGPTRAELRIREAGPPRTYRA